nr:lipid droplet-associated hydrolase isoform X2 [Ipomoea batatas]
MVLENSSLITKKQHANFRLCNVSGYKTDLLEVHAQDPKLHVVFIPGNPGVISFYVDFIESLYELLGGTASITGKEHWLLNRKFILKFIVIWEKYFYRFAVMPEFSIFQLSSTYLMAKRIGSMEGCFR